MRLRDAQAFWAGAPKEAHVLLSVYSEAVVHAFRPFKPIEADVQKILVHFLEHDAAVDFGTNGEGIGVAFARSAEIGPTASEEQVRAVVRNKFIVAFQHFVPEGSRKMAILVAVEQALANPPPYRTALFDVRGGGRTLSTVYSFSTDLAAVELVDQRGAVVGTLVRHQRFWPSDLLVSATRGSIRGSIAYLYDGSRRLVGEVELDFPQGRQRQRADREL